MWNKVAMFPLMAYLTVTGFAQDLRDDERGLSGVVVAVLLILIAVLAVVFLWGGLGEYLNDLWEQVTTPEFNEI